MAQTHAQHYTRWRGELVRRRTCPTITLSTRAPATLLAPRRHHAGHHRGDLIERLRFRDWPRWPRWRPSTRPLTTCTRRGPMAPNGGSVKLAMMVGIAQQSWMWFSTCTRGARRVLLSLSGCAPVFEGQATRNKEDYNGPCSEPNTTVAERDCPQAARGQAHRHGQPGVPGMPRGRIQLDDPQPPRRSTCFKIVGAHGAVP